MTGKELLEGIADVFEFNPDAWTRHSSAKDDFGDATPSDSESASRWCIVGALWTNKASRKVEKLVDKTAYSLYGKDILTVNDVYGREAVVRVLRRAVTKL